MKRGGYIAVLAAVTLAATPVPALAADPPPSPSAAVDPRIRTIFYNPDSVTSLRGVFGYQVMIEFGADERIENVSIGDSLAWQVTPNRRANRLFLKPVDKNATTNMTVVTDRRQYLFELSARSADGARASDMPYLIRFTYPVEPAPPVTPPPPPPAPPEQRNKAYTYTGSRTLLPSLVFDDGQFTYFQWPKAASTPALFLVAPDGSESIVNYGVRQDYVVVEQVAPRFVLRNGAEVTTVINDGWREPVAGALAPQPHDAKTAREAAKAGIGR